MKERLYELGPSGLHRVLEELSNELGSMPEVAFAYLHGSAIEGRPFHDLDVAVYFPGDGAGLPQAASLADRLSRRVGMPVDARVLNHAPVSFVFHALKGYPLACRDEALLAEVMEDTVRRYLDIAPLLRRSTREAYGE